MYLIISYTTVFYKFINIIAIIRCVMFLLKKTLLLRTNNITDQNEEGI